MANPKAVILSFLFCSLLAVRAEAAPTAELWAFWQPTPASLSESTDQEPINHELWQQLLDRHLSEPGDQINRFDYPAATAADRALLSAYLDSLTGLDPRGFPIDEQMAYWINLYNALTVQVVLDHPNKGSILRMGAGWFRIGPWDDELVTVAGQPITLNDIEHRILRPIWQDRRIHFAVNCASLGCPNLSTQAFTSVSLESMLAAAEQAYLNHPRGVSFNDKGELVLSSIFEWYVEDFADDRAQLLKYLSQHHDTLTAQLVNYTGPIRYQYDWSLNQP